ncbi:MAG: hypothetical protein K9N35_06285 [Candidatus Marinimicrobia bacterium]|nr:hypothetical protein [Candidatus Neomarinimicrobiota bacterium]
MQQKNDSNMIYRIIIIFLVLLGLSVLVRIIPAVFHDQSLSMLEQLIYGGLFILLAAGIIYVFIQKNNREKQETFRREKW